MAKLEHAQYWIRLEKYLTIREQKKLFTQLAKDFGAKRLSMRLYDPSEKCEDSLIEDTEVIVAVKETTGTGYQWRFMAQKYNETGEVIGFTEFPAKELFPKTYNYAARIAKSKSQAAARLSI